MEIDIKYKNSSNNLFLRYNIINDTYAYRVAKKKLIKKISMLQKPILLNIDKGSTNIKDFSCFLVNQLQQLLQHTMSSRFEIY